MTNTMVILTWALKGQNDNCFIQIIFFCAFSHGEIIQLNNQPGALLFDKNQCALGMTSGLEPFSTMEWAESWSTGSKSRFWTRTLFELLGPYFEPWKRITEVKQNTEQKSESAPRSIELSVNAFRKLLLDNRDQRTEWQRSYNRYD